MNELNLSQYTELSDAEREILKKLMADTSEFAIPSYEQWKNATEKTLKGVPFDKKLITQTVENISSQPIYMRHRYESLPSSIRSQRQWRSAVRIPVTDSLKWNQLVLNALMTGQDDICLRTEDAQRLSAQELSQLLQGIDLGAAGLYVNTGTQFDSVYNKIAQRGREQLTGCIGAAPLYVAATSGNDVFAESTIFSDMAAYVTRTSAPHPALRTILLSGEPCHNAGASAVTELAYVLGELSLYLNKLSDYGLEAKAFFSALAIEIFVDTSFFMSVAKLRAFRYLVGAMARHAGIDELEQPIHIVARTSSRVQAANDWSSNILRETTQIMSAAMGGADSIHSLLHNATTSHETDAVASRIARNIHSIAREECGLSDVDDPAAGSYYVEDLTAKIARESWDAFVEMEKNGGVLEALKQGIVQSQVSQDASYRATEVNKRKRVLIGVNSYIDPDLEKFYNSEDRDTAVDTDFMPLSSRRTASEFEKLQSDVAKLVHSASADPLVTIVPVGKLSALKPRIDFSINYFQAGGYSVDTLDAMASVEDAVTACRQSNALVWVICALDDDYAEILQEIMAARRESRTCQWVVSAGRPGENEQRYLDLGVNSFIYMGQNVYAQLRTIYEAL